MSKPGDVYIHENFKYSNGTTGKKLIVVLNDAAACSLCLVLKTTSKSDRYVNAKPGCNPELGVYFVPEGWQEFKVSTYIQMKPIFEFNLGKFISDGRTGTIRKLFSLDKKCYELVIKCLMHNFKEDVPEKYWDMIKY